MTSFNGHKKRKWGETKGLMHAQGLGLLVKCFPKFKLEHYDVLLVITTAPAITVQ